MNVRQYEVETAVYSDNCSSCGAKGKVYELRLKHGGEGSALCIPLCRDCFNKFTADINREYAKCETEGAARKVEETLCEKCVAKFQKAEAQGISPTPWKCVGGNSVMDANGHHVFSCDVWSPCASPDTFMCGASPELYEACAGLLEIVCDGCKEWWGKSKAKCIGCPRVKAARAAMRRAEGKAVEE